MTMVRCEICEMEYFQDGERFCHGKGECVTELTRVRDELREYLVREGPEHLGTENACLRGALARSENEKKMALDALSRTQRRCTELLEEVRLLKGGA